MKSNPKKCRGSILLDSAIAATVLLGMVPQSSFAVQRLDNVQQNASVLKGTVVDANGEPIIGASVTEDGTQNGTVTDLNGNFTLSHLSSLKVPCIRILIGQQHRTLRQNNKRP